MHGDGELPSLILVDDDPLIVETLSFALQDSYTVHSAGNRTDTNTLLRGLDPVPDLALVDLGLPPVPHEADEGFALITELLAFNRCMKILVLSGQSSRTNIQHALTLGAVDFVPKPCDADLLKARLTHQQLILEAETPAASKDAETGELLLGGSRGVITLRELIEQFANMPFPVLIEGESGSGKELVANCLHNESIRAGHPLMTINCAAFTPELLEAQLFGHCMGAFTGATTDRSGFFEQATDGTLFLDEVGEMPLALQTKFLRVLENGEFYRLGETQLRQSKARIIAATNRDLREAVRTGAFRADLFHRLSVLSIVVPPLRERGADWEVLLEHFQQQYASSVPPFRLAPEARDAMAAYGFPGNVRELRNIVIRLGARYPGRTVSAEQVDTELESGIIAVSGPGEQQPSRAAISEEIKCNGFRLDDTINALERQYIDAALQLCDGNLSKAARLLGVNRTTLYNKAQRLGLEN